MKPYEKPRVGAGTWEEEAGGLNLVVQLLDLDNERL